MEDKPCTCEICLKEIEEKEVVEDVGTKEHPREKHYHLECLMEQPPYELMMQ